MKIETINCEEAINIKNLARDFKVRQKSQGIKASIKNFFSPTYKTVEAVKQLSLKIPCGEIVGFLGPNGAGKTTTLKMLSGLLVPTSGSIEVLGYEPFKRDHEFLTNISLVMGQKQNLWWDLPPTETFEIHRQIYRIEENDYKERITELIEMLEIEECLETQTRKLSLGQRMRCELAVSLLHRPKILFLDEPTIGLDILMQKKIRSFLLDYHRRFKPTILLTSHYMDDVSALAKRVVVINRGTKVFDGSLKDLTEKMQPEKIVTVILNTPECSFPETGNYEILEKTANLLRIKVPKEEAGKLAAGLYNSCNTLDLSIEDTPLEDIIGRLYSETQNTTEEIRENV
jgi:ABC-2 type transport system ATP-binding protein